MTISSTDLVDYFFRFADFGAAARDLIVGPLLVTPPLPGFPPKEILVFPNRTANSVVPASGYWVVITTQGTNPTLGSHPNLQIVNDLTLMGAGKNSVISTTLDVTNAHIVHSGYGLYCNALALI